MLYEYCEFKTDKIKDRCRYLHGELILILNDMAMWCEEDGLPFVITDSVSTLEEDKKLNRVSTTHRTRRAVDISTRKWPNQLILEFQEYFSEKYKYKAAVSNKTKRPELIIRHDSGHGDHFHVQISARFALPVLENI